MILYIFMRIKIHLIILENIQEYMYKYLFPQLFPYFVSQHSIS